MPRIEFHFNAPDKLAYACRLLRKAVAAGARVVVLGNASDMGRLDTELWTFAPLEFVPHARAPAPPEVAAASPVWLTHALDTPLPHHDVLLHLGSDMPLGFEAFARVIEVVSLDDADRQQARQRWRGYTELGLTLLRHDLQLKESTA